MNLITTKGIKVYDSNETTKLFSLNVDIVFAVISKIFNCVNLNSKSVSK